MEDVVMNGLKLKSCGEFAIGKYRSRKDVLRRKDVKEEQMNKHESESTEKQPEQINNR